MLTLDASGFVTLLYEAGLVYGTHALRMIMPPGDILLCTISCSGLIPAEQTEELLQVPWWLTESVGHWFNTLSGQVAQLAFDVEIEIASRCDSAETVVKLLQEFCQFRFDSHNRFGIHVDNLLKNNPLQEYHRLAA
jgi:hypothetical protein